MSARGLTARNLAPLLLGVALNPINSSIIATALVPIGDAFHATAAQTAWGLLLMAVAGIGGSLAASLDVLIGWRVVLGLGTSAAYPAAMILVRRFAANERGRLHGGALSAVTIAGQVSVVIGPALGGALVALAGWRANVVAVVPVAVFAAILGVCWLPRETTTPEHAGSIRDVDFAGIATFAAGLTFLLVSLLHQKSASIVFVTAAFLCFAIWYIIERRSSAPFIDVRMLLRAPRLLAIYGRYIIIYTIFYTVFYGLPQWLEQSHRSSPAQAGLLMLPTAIVAIACAMLAGQWQPKQALLAGCAGALTGALCLRQLHAASPAYAILAVNAIFGVPNGMNPVSEQSTLSMHADVQYMGVASGLLRTAGYIGAMIASSLIAVTFRGGADDRSLQLLAAILAGLAAMLVLISGARVLRSRAE